MFKIVNFGFVSRAYSSKHHNVSNIREYLRQFKKLDKTGKVIELDKNDLRVIYMTPGTKGGQKANKKKCRVHITHIPTNTIIDCNETRLKLDNYEIAVAKLREAVDIKMKNGDSVFVHLEMEKEKKRREEKRLAKEKHEILQERIKRFKEIMQEPDTLKY